jgi:hypothetical protein
MMSRLQERSAFLDALGSIIAAFDPSQPRDELGRWTDTGAADVAPPAETPQRDEAEHVRNVLKSARDVAKELNFDPKKISIGAAKSPDVDFVLNGKPYKAAGLAYSRGAHPLKGHVKLFTEQIPNVSSVPGIAAHEIQHIKFQTALDKYQAEYDAVMKEPLPPPKPESEHAWERHGGPDAIMAPDGSLRPPYDTKYPVYTAIDEAFKHYSLNEFADADGVSGYSYEYWKAWKQTGGHEVSFEIAVHETLAEMARIKYETGKFPNHYGEGIIAYRGEDKPKPPQSVIDANAKRWRDLYRAVEKVYRSTL